MKIRTINPVAVVIAFLMQLSCDSMQGPKLMGTYTRRTEVDPNSTLVVTKDSMAQKVGPLTISFGYKVVSSNVNSFVLDVTPHTPPGRGPERAFIEVAPTSLTIRTDLSLRGTWTRK
jgi:hypothetical protein